MKFEFSAGGIVYKKIKDPASPAKRGEQKSKIKDKIFVLICQHSQHHGWVFPKGLIGDHIKGENKEDTAIREVKEETGIEAKIVEVLEPVTYWYVFKGQRIKKTVFYYIMEFLKGDIKNHDWEMENVEWLEKEKVMDRLTYSSDKKVFEKALPVIEKLAS